MTLAFVAALIGALGYGAGSTLQAYAATAAHGPNVLRHPAYVVGSLCDAVAWLASLVALRQLPLFAVQSVLAGSLGVTVILARIFLDARLAKRDAVALVLVVVALSGVAGAAGVKPAQKVPANFTVLALLGLFVLAVALLAFYRRGQGAALAVLAGLGFSGAAICARALDSGGTALWGEPLAWSVVGFGLIGMVAYARSLEAGAVGPVTAVLWVVEVVVAGLVGLIALGDSVRPGWQITALVGVGVAVAACVLLATGHANTTISASPPRSPQASS